MAKLIALGFQKNDVASICGVTPDLINRLSNHDTMFKGLVEFYRKDEHEEFDRIHDNMVELIGESLDEIRARLADDPGKFTPTQLLKIMTEVGDRAGYGPTRKEEKTVNIQAELWQQLERGERRAQGAIIDGTAEEVP